MSKCRLSPEHWADVRRDYESGENVNALHKRYGVTRETICRRIEIEGWTVNPEVIAQRALCPKCGEPRPGGKCKPCLKAYRARYFQEVGKARQRERNKANPPDRRDYLKDYYQKNREQMIARAVAWGRANKPKRAQIVRGYNNRNA